ncbi:MAG TPA: DNA topoisomerase [Phycisphaerales bacterium]|nr:DNA topoisomerase [Phycisphaerales bacterium]
MAKRPATKKSKAPTDGASGTATAEPAARGRSRGGRGGKMQSYTAGSARDKHLVIVESPSKAKTINKYLGKDFVVLASVGHVRDLPGKNPKGVKSPVPGVDLEHDFKPTYVISEGKEKVISDLKRAAKDAIGTGMEVWFATDLDREGEAIAWHLAQELGIAPSKAKRVVFAAITKSEIDRAFKNPHPIDEDRVNAQQARRIVDRIVGYQASPLLWKKVARGLSAGRVQSVAVRLIVEREREIRAFIPDEYWAVEGFFTPEMAKAAGLGKEWGAFLATRDEKNNPPTLKARGGWLNEHAAIRAELIEVAGEKFAIGSQAAGKDGAWEDLTGKVKNVARLAGLNVTDVATKENKSGRGPARFERIVKGTIDPAAKYTVTSIETKRTTTRPPPPFITSSMQAAAASRFGFAAQRTMRAAQNLYEGIDIPGEGPMGLITYMRTDSTHISGEALSMAREYIERTFGGKYMPDKPNFFSSSNKAAQEAHEAIRPTNVDMTPARVRRALTDDQFKLYTLIWERFVACQMVAAQWDSTAVLITGGTNPKTPCTFRATGRVLVFDGFMKVTGVYQSADEQNLPRLAEQQPVAPFAIHADQKFTSAPARFSEASLIKMLEKEGIGRPSTYASIISVIQDRAYVEKEKGQFFATDLGEVVTDKLIEAFPDILEVGYTREMETQLDKVEEEHLDWIDMLRKFYKAFKKDLDSAETNLVHAKAETVPAPDEYTCPTCEKEGRGRVGLVYRFGKNGRFLSCSKYPECNYASPVDREGKPRPAAEMVDVACPKCGAPMTKRVGKFGPFLGCSKYGDKTAPCDGILNLDRKSKVVAPSPPAFVTDLPCSICEAPLNLRNGLKGPWLGCSRFPKCRGRGKWAELDEKKRAELEKALEAHSKAHPAPIIRTIDGKPLTDSTGKPLATSKPVRTAAELAAAEEETGGEVVEVGEEG